MKISENKIVTGMFFYDESSTFTPNDFVIEDGIIYVCDKEAFGKRPSTNPDYFTIYLGKQSISLPEYLDFLETGEGENKYLSVNMLQAVISTYMTGPTGKGIIGDYVYYNNGQMYLHGITGEGAFEDPEIILSQIMAHPDLNNCMFRVSRNLPEIYAYVGNPGISDYSSEDAKSCILRQYTYIKEGTTNTKVRVQELIDPIDGLIWYRSLVLPASYGAASGTWKCSVVNSSALKVKVENILGLYTSRLKVLKSLETHLKSNFRYSKLTLRGSNTQSFSVGDNTEYTILISERLSSGLIKNYQISLNLEDIVSDREYYMVSDSLRLNVSYGVIQLEDISGNTNPSAWISSVYYKEYYGAS